MDFLIKELAVFTFEYPVVLIWPDNQAAGNLQALKHAPVFQRLVQGHAKVVFADIDPVSMNLDPQKAREKITEKTKAIIAVHFAGLACDLDAYDAITRETGIPVIYDAAHAVGCT